VEYFRLCRIPIIKNAFVEQDIPVYALSPKSIILNLPEQLSKPKQVKAAVVVPPLARHRGNSPQIMYKVECLWMGRNQCADGIHCHQAG